MSDTLEQAVADRLQGFLADGHLVRGAQAVVFQGGTLRANVAVGTDYIAQPLTTEHVSCVYCCTKVPLYTTFLAMMEAGVAQLTTTIGELLPDANPWVASCTISELLGQRGGFTMLDGPVSRFIPDHLRQVSQQWLMEPEQRPRGTLAYSISEVAWLVAAIIEKASGRHYAQQIGHVLPDLLGPDVLPVQNGPLTVTYQLDPETDTPVPLLNEIASVVRGQWNPALGWYTSALGMARLGVGLNDAWHGRTKLGAPMMQYAATPGSEPEIDPGLGCEATYGLGFWTSMEELGFGTKLSDTAFGHGAQGGTASLVIDPERELVAAFSFDLALDSTASTPVRRAPLTDLIIDVVDG